MLKALSKNDTIGIINPAFKNPDDVFNKYQKMIECLENYGFKIKFGKTFTLQNGYLAGTDNERATDLNDMFRDDEVKAIICMRGGYGASRMVDLVDYELIKKHPKIICGFSDITVLLNAIYKKTNIPTIHGLVSLFLGSKVCDDFSTKDFFKILTEKQKGRVLENPNKDAKTLIPGIVKGKLVGGNLSLIATLIGSEYEIDFEDKIIFIEEVTEEPYQIDRYLSQIRLNKMFEKAKGFVFGYFTDCNPSEGRIGTQTYLDIIKDYVGSLNKPTIYDFACGHDFPFINLPIGVEVTLDAFKKQIIIEEEIYE